MWSEQNLELSRFGLRKLRRSSIGPDSPGFVPADLRVLMLPAEDGIREYHIFAPGLLVVVNGASVAGQGPSGPFFPGSESLSEERIHSGARILDRLHAAHRLLGAL